MRIVKTGVITLALVSASVIGAGMAQAATIDVTAELVACAATAGLDAATAAELEASIGKSIEVSAETEAQLEAKGCI